MPILPSSPASCPSSDMVSPDETAMVGTLSLSASRMNKSLKSHNELELFKMEFFESRHRGGVLSSEWLVRVSCHSGSRNKQAGTYVRHGGLGLKINQGTRKEGQAVRHAVRLSESAFVSLKRHVVVMFLDLLSPLNQIKFISDEG